MNVLDLIKRSLILFYLGFPLILISTLLFLGFGLGNAGLLFLSAGHILIVPLVVMILHFFTQILEISKIPYSNIGLLVPSTGVSSSTAQINVFPTYWSSHLAFFCAYIFFNAYNIYIQEPNLGNDTFVTKIQNRKSRTALIMAFTLITYFAFMIIRYKVTNTENIIGMLIASIVMGVFGYIWFLISSTIQIKIIDIFGIVQQMDFVADNTPTVCVNQT